MSVQLTRAVLCCASVRSRSGFVQHAIRSSVLLLLLGSQQQQHRVFCFGVQGVLFWRSGGFIYECSIQCSATCAGMRNYADLG
jgi:hypothetical protein